MSTEPPVLPGAADPPTSEDRGFDDPYFTAEERADLLRWRTVCATLPPPTTEEVESVAAVIRRIEQDHGRAA